LPNVESSRQWRLRAIRIRIVDFENRRFQFIVEMIQNHRKHKSGTAGFASRAIVFAVFFFFGVVMAGIRFVFVFFAAIGTAFLSLATRTLSHLHIEVLLREHKNPQTENHKKKLQFSQHRFAKLGNLYEPQKAQKFLTFLL